MINPNIDILKVFEGIEPFTGKWNPVAAKDWELSQTRQVISRLNQYATDVKNFVSNCPGLKIISDFNLPKLDIVSKNISWLTSISILKLGNLKFTIDNGDPETYDELGDKLLSIKEKIHPFEQLYSSGIIIPIPSVIEEYDGLNNYSNSYNLSNDIVDAGFSNSFLSSLITENYEIRPYGVLELCLPRVSKISQEKILEIRNDHNDLFLRFQNELAKFIRKSEESDSERKLVDMLLQIDEEIRSLRREFEIINNKKRLELLGLSFSFGVLSLVLVLPKEIYMAITEIWNAPKIYKSIKNIRLIKIEQRKLTDDPFYIPYRLSKLSEPFLEKK